MDGKETRDMTLDVLRQRRWGGLMEEAKLVAPLVGCTEQKAAELILLFSLSGIMLMLQETMMGPDPQGFVVFPQTVTGPLGGAPEPNGGM